ncbi:hypothetical protein B296_00023951, partial [Ensete ventricosum]
RRRKEMGSSAEQDYDYSFKILLSGDSGVGKSSLVQSFISHFVDNNRPTLGAVTPIFFLDYLLPMTSCRHACIEFMVSLASVYRDGFPDQISHSRWQEAEAYHMGHCWSLGRGKGFSSGRSLIPARRSGRIGSRRDLFDYQVSLVVDFVILLLRRGARVFIAIVTGYSYLKPLSSLLLTILLHLTTPSVVLTARRAPAAGGCRPCPPYLDLAERVNSGTNLGDLAERMNSGTNLGDLVERMNSGTNLGDLTEKMNSGLAEKVNSGTNPRDLVERVNSSTNPEDLAERMNSGTNPGDLDEKMNSGINLGDLAERVNSGTNPKDLPEKVNSGTNLGDLAERVNSGTNPRDLTEKVNSGLAEKVNSGTNPGDLAEKVNSSTNPGDLVERISHLQQELDALKSRGSPEAVAKAEKRTSEL